MKKHLSAYIIILFAFLLLASSFAAADTAWFVNDGSTVLPQFFDGVYAVGSGGTELLSGSRLYAMSAEGLLPLGAANSTGGGGLRYDDHTVSISGDQIRVGLYYFYTASRDCSVESAVLENVVGSGYSVGILNDEADYEELAVTASHRITVKPAWEIVVSVYDGGAEPLVVLAETGRSAFLEVHPNAEQEDAVTKLAGRKYYGSFRFAVLGSSRRLTVVNQLALEQYVMGVCACEMSESWPVEALKAQAVAARTYAQKMICNSLYYYSCGFDLTADTYCQAYLGCGSVGKNIEAAVNGTANQYLTYKDALADALYSAADGGSTESNSNVFGNNAHPYLVGIVDPFEASASENPYLQWTVTMTPKQLGAKVGIGPVKEITPTYSETGNVIKLELISTSGERAVILRDSCRTVLGLKNIHYEIEMNAAGDYVFTGSGFGHNLGMSQWGAYSMAKYFAKDYKAILGFYYTDVGLSYGERDV